MDKIISIAIAFLVLALIGAIALNLFFGTNTSSWDSNTRTIWAYLPQIFILGGIVILLFLAIGHFMNKEKT